MSTLRYFALGATLAAIGGGAGVVAESAAAHATTAHTASAAAVKLANVSLATGGKHSVLVTSSGRAVYLLTGDSVKTPKCTSATCLGAWPAVTTSAKKPALGKGIMGKLTVWNHKGMHQLVLNGHPLYTFVKDSSANKAAGAGLKGFGGTWELLTASGAGFTAPVKSAPTTPTTTTPATTTTSSSGGSSWS